MSTKDGGPAFPFLEVDHDGRSYHQNSGLSLRDYFAIHAEKSDLTQLSPQQFAQLAGGFTGSYHTLDHLLWLAETKATLRYLMADAMLKAREKHNAN